MMKWTEGFILNLKRMISGRRLYSVFIPALLWGDLLDAQGAADPQKVYRPTAAQLRMEQQNRERALRIQAIRNLQALQQKKAALAARNAAAKQTSAAAEPAGQTAVPTVRIRYIWYKSSRYALVQDIARYYGMKVTYFKTGLTMRSLRDTITLQYDRRLAIINQISAYLTNPPILRGALVYLNEKDFQLVIDPVIRNAPLWKHPKKIILIDPGHGGRDQGAPGVSGILEKNVTLSLGHRLALLLRKRGYRVFMTRINDRDLTLQQRVAMCEKLKPDLFVSIHCNAVKNRRIMGVETYAATPQGAASTSDTKPVVQASAGNSFNRNNYRLAYEVQKNLLAFTRAPDRGVRHARFFVIRNAVCPAILIETGFVTHPKEGLLLNTAAYQQNLVNGIFCGILAYDKATALPQKTLPSASKPVRAKPPVRKSAPAPVKKTAGSGVKTVRKTP